MKKDKKEYNEWDWEVDNAIAKWDNATEEERQKMMNDAQALFNSDKSPLAFIVKSNGSVSFVRPEKKKWQFWKR